MYKIMVLGIVGALSIVGVAATSFWYGSRMSQTPAVQPQSVGARPSDHNSLNPTWMAGLGHNDPGQAGIPDGCCDGQVGHDAWGNSDMRGWMMGPMHGTSAAITATVPAPTTARVSYQDDVQPIFDARCVACHGGTQGLYLTDYASALRGGSNGPVVVPADPSGSRLIQYVVRGYMPRTGEPLTQTEIQILVNWVAAGAPDN